MDTRRVLAVVYAGVFALMVLLAGESKGAEEGDASVPIRIGWQIPQVTQAAIVQVLKRTDVLTRYGLEPSLIPFSLDRAGDGLIHVNQQPMIDLYQSMSQHL